VAWIWFLVALYALGGMFTLGVMVMDARRTNERWPWQAYPLAFLLWFPIVAISLVQSSTKEANR